MPIGYLAIILHTHLPFVKHPEHEEFLEEDWLFEAVTETYIPLIDVYQGLLDDNIDFRITMSLTPPLCEMLVDPLLQDRCARYINKRVELMEREVHHTRNTPFHNTALMYQQRLSKVRYIYEDVYKRNILDAFRKFQSAGKLEIITSAATHGFLPLMLTEDAIHAQVQAGCNNYKKHFGKLPKGFWLPECGYRPGIEAELKKAGVEFFILDTHGILHGSPRPKYGIFAPILCPNGVAVFGRDVESSKQVWSAKDGYPGDWNYREFYRDLGYDADYDYIRPYLHADGVRRNVGIKYYKITGNVPLSDKQPYDPNAAREKAAEHAGNFMFNRQAQARYLSEHLGIKSIIISPYDAELYGHWWFEGPQFLNYLIRKIACDQQELKLITPSEYISENPKAQIVTPSQSTWGDKGYNEVWLNGSNDWIYRHLHKAEERMIELANSYYNAEGDTKRALNLAARELLLAQSSDWAFIMTAGTMAPYAERRTREHISRFITLYEQIKKNQIDLTWLQDIEYKDSIFQEIDFRVYAKLQKL
ncbi:MAG TPA: glycoside hydrolase family 57 protein [Candidatus Brocadiia bacterium]|nr:DUF1957 domain-containing protein [Planctomycetota bacterium]MDO8094179.1 DUF1957 domain-containing protein [Candidatus Brocadiales bacterium]